MTKVEKDLLLQDICARLPYGVVVQEPDYYEAPLTISTLSEVYYNDLEVKPYLRPMSSMTEEERLYFHRNSAKVQILVDEEKVITKPFYGYTIHLFNWLNSHHFDYRNLIEKDLALEAHEGMYNYK